MESRELEYEKQGIEIWKVGNWNMESRELNLENRMNTGFFKTEINLKSFIKSFIKSFFNHVTRYIFQAIQLKHFIN